MRAEGRTREENRKLGTERKDGRVGEREVTLSVSILRAVFKKKMPMCVRFPPEALRASESLHDRKREQAAPLR